MPEQPSYAEIALRADISPSYANEIVRGERRPSLAMALKIFDATGCQFGTLAGLSKREIEAVRKVAA